MRIGVAAGLSVFNGLHTSMASDPQLQALFKEGQLIWDVRQEPTGLGVGSAQARSLSCRRILTVGTNMSVGKMSASLELNRAAQQAIEQVREETGLPCTDAVRFGADLLLDAVMTE